MVEINITDDPEIPSSEKHKIEGKGIITYELSSTDKIIFETAYAADGSSEIILKPGAQRKLEIFKKDVTLTGNLEYDMLNGKLKGGAGIAIKLSKNATFDLSHGPGKTSATLKITLGN